MCRRKILDELTSMYAFGKNSIGKNIFLVELEHPFAVARIEEEFRIAWPRIC
jgi:hypothetical protein